MAANAEILLVEDDQNLGYILSEYLAMKGFVITWAKDGKEAVNLIRKNPYSLCILDVMLPSLDGFDVAREIAASTFKVPFIFLTAKTLKVDRLKGFSLGCDDYILKPVDEEELVARINAVLKRTAGAVASGGGESRLGHSIFHADAQELETRGNRYKLTAKESAMLLLLLTHKNQLVDRETALKKIWGSNDYFNRRSMDVIISRLRKHLAADRSLRITNIHGKGYMLSEEIV
ncbi:MAG: response regulator transcription factor [Chitinophagaceae bacterium]|nr:response regulator transcription factor [Chitinophagaceae bacterium]